MIFLIKRIEIFAGILSVFSALTTILFGAVLINSFEPDDLLVQSKILEYEKNVIFVTESPSYVDLDNLEITEYYPFDNDEIYLIALITMAEAEGECEYGKRLVVDTILNRFDSDDFPNTISEVIYQKNAFESVWNGRVDKCFVDDYILSLVKEEILFRTDFDVIFFASGDYSKYGSKLFKVGNHYFSKK